MGYRVDLSKKPNEIVIDRINYVFNKDYKPSQITFGSSGTCPLERAEREKYGVESKVAAYYGNGVYGHVEFFLTRADLTRLLDGITLQVPKGSIHWSHELAPQIQKDLGLQIYPPDIMAELVSPDADTYTVRLLPNHLSFKGVLKVEFIDPRPRKLQELVTKRALDGFKFGEFINGQL